MDTDEEEPPMLVSANGDTNPVQESLASEMADVKLAKVPISIITGRTSISPINHSSVAWADQFLHVTLVDLLSCNRLPWSRQNHIVELHSHSSPWEEDCSYFEW